MTQPDTSHPVNFFRLYFGSALLTLGMIGSSIIIGPVIMLCSGLPFASRYRIANQWIRFVLFAAKICCGVRYEVEGLEHLKEVPTAIVLSKHQSAWETIALRLILPMQTALLKESLVKIPVWGWALAKLRPIAIDRDNQRAALRKLLKEGKECLDDGIWVVVFPEGTRTAPGETRKFNAGGAILAEKTCYPVIAVAHNAGQYWARNSFLKYPGTIKVKISPPMSTQGRKAAEINEDAARWIADAMTMLE